MNISMFFTYNGPCIILPDKVGTTIHNALYFPFHRLNLNTCRYHLSVLNTYIRKFFLNFYLGRIFWLLSLTTEDFFLERLLFTTLR